MTIACSSYPLSLERHLLHKILNLRDLKSTLRGIVRWIEDAFVAEINCLGPIGEVTGNIEAGRSGIEKPCAQLSEERFDERFRELTK
jgi:hypothetical protein